MIRGRDINAECERLRVGRKICRRRRHRKKNEMSSDRMEEINRRKNKVSLYIGLSLKNKCTEEKIVTYICHKDK